ncbi:MAG TPA: NAD(P)-dependent oxidoreductase [Nitrospiraceae bacterium]|nr:NAD(P)-dependent oxidoreductase [Nitrospiraceae bacterium]
MPPHERPAPRMASPLHTRVGWIGAGVMGAALCHHLQRARYRITLHSRTRAKAAPILADGATWAASPRAVAENTDIVFTMVGFPHEVRSVYLGEQGLLAGARPGMILVDMTTTEPGLAREIESIAEVRGVWSVDAPVSGGDVGAKNGSLSIMVGGQRGAVQAIIPILELFGRKIVHHGGNGLGQQAKLANQIVIAGTMVGVCEALLYSSKAGLESDRLLDSIRGGAAGCWTLDHLAPRIHSRDFTAGFFVDHFLKDMAIALEESRRMGLALPGLDTVHRLYQTVQELGHGRSGTQALILALEHLSTQSRAGTGLAG